MRLTPIKNTTTIVANAGIFAPELCQCKCSLRDLSKDMSDRYRSVMVRLKKVKCVIIIIKTS